MGDKEFARPNLGCMKFTKGLKKIKSQLVPVRSYSRFANDFGATTFSFWLILI